MNNRFTRIKDFYLPVLGILREAGGSAQLNDICDQFLKKYQGNLDESYFTEIKDGDVKWRDYINRAGYQLTQRGYIVRGPKRGVWQLTDKVIPENVTEF